LVDFTGEKSAKLREEDP